MRCSHHTSNLADDVAEVGSWASRYLCQYLQGAGGTRNTGQKWPGLAESQVLCEGLGLDLVTSQDLEFSKNAAVPKKPRSQKRVRSVCTSVCLHARAPSDLQPPPPLLGFRAGARRHPRAPARRFAVRECAAFGLGSPGTPFHATCVLFSSDLKSSAFTVATVRGPLLSLRKQRAV